MQCTERAEKEKLDARNALEEYVYDMRDKMIGDWRDYILPEQREEFESRLSATENWIYDEGEDAERGVYASRLQDLQKTSDPVRKRVTEWSSRPAALDEFGRAVNQARKFIAEYQSGEEKYAHLAEEDVNKVIDALSKRESQLNEWARMHSTLQKHQDVPHTESSMRTALKDFNKFWVPIATKPKPKVEEPAKQEPPPMETDADKGEEQKEAPKEAAEAGMDVD